jgi:prepilin-type N-terminal cleavage/methylation domain-containing protein
VTRGRQGGFTLIELSIVLVVIGLIVGGVLAGQSLIAAAAVRAQITQIEKFNTAAATFQGKYGGLPGDLQLSLATQFGFNVTDCEAGSGHGVTGHRDGNGLIDGGNGRNNVVLTQEQDETALFWEDLSQSGLISDTIPGGGVSFVCDVYGGIPPVLSNSPGINYFGNYFPQAKVGSKDFVYVYENAGFNWFGLLGMTSTDEGMVGLSDSGDLPPSVAASMDLKIDDGLPTTGSVQASYVKGISVVFSPNSSTPSYTGPAGYTSTYCYYTTPTPQYDTAVNGGSSPMCALSFRMQAGD